MKIITTKSKGLFKDAHFLQARELTEDDFIFESEETKLPETLDDFRWTTRLCHTLTGTLTDECVQELNKYKFFKSMRSHDVNDLEGQHLYNAISREASISVPIVLSTENGGKVKSLAKKLERTEIAKAKLREMIIRRDDVGEFISVEIARFNERISSIVEDNNRNVESDIRRNLTSRSSLLEIVELNKDSFNSDELKAVNTFDKNVADIDSTINELKRKLGEAEQLKAKEYISLSKIIYADDLANLPSDIRKEFSILYNKLSTFGPSVNRRGLTIS